MSDVNKPFVSVILPVYNCENYIKESVESILNQDYSNFELIVIEDASADSTAEVLESIADQRMRVHYQEENIGLVRSLNKAIDLAHGEYIARQDADDISKRSRLTEQVKVLNSNQKIGLVGTGYGYINENNVAIGQHIPKEKPNFKDFSYRNRICHGSVMIRKKCLEEVGYYNQRYEHCEDYELWLRVVSRYKVYNIQKKLYYVRKHNEQIRNIKSRKMTLLFLCAQLEHKNDTVIKNNKGDIDEGEIYNKLPVSYKIRYHEIMGDKLIRDQEGRKAMEHYKKAADLSDSLNSNLRLFIKWISANLPNRVRSSIVDAVKNYRSFRGK